LYIGSLIGIFSVRKRYARYKFPNAKEVPIKENKCFTF